jgi:CubicO group peptidase (beta-lactamase class C family)
MAAPDRPLFERAFDIAAAQVADGTAPWVIVGLADATDTLDLRAFPGPHQPSVGVHTVGLLASITKPIVATVVMQLATEGRLVLGEPIDRILGQRAEDDTVVTPWHLLSHTSGMPEIDLEGLVAANATHADVVARQLAAPLATAPGAAFSYTTSTYDLLGAIITTLDGRPYPDAIRARLLAPLGMADTTFDPRPSHGDRLVMPLVSPINTEPFPTAMAEAFIRLAPPGGGLWSTAADLLRFGRAMLRGGELEGVRVLPATFVDLMTREATVGPIGASGDPITDAHYALGWGKPGVTTPGSAAAFGHGGATGTRLWIDPGHDLVFVYLTGVWGYPTEPVDRVMNAVYAAIG